MIFTQEMIEEIKQRLVLCGIKDTQMSKVDLLENPLDGKETLVLVKDGVNYRITIEDLYEDMAKYIGEGENKEDFFNVSAYLGRLNPDTEEPIPCTLSYAIKHCPSYIRKTGQVISFLDSSDSKWKAYQKQDSTKEWEDTSAFSPFHLVDHITFNEGLNPEDEGYIVDSSEIGVTQRAVQEVVNRLQNRLNQLISQTADVSFWCYTKNGGVLTYVGDNSGTIHVAAREQDGLPMDSFRVTKDGEEVYSDDYPKDYFEYNASEVSNEPKSVIWGASVVIAGVNKNLGTKECSFVYPIYYGAGQSWDSATSKPEIPKATAVGSYNINVATTGDSIFFLIPANLNNGKLGKVTLNGYEMLFDPSVIVSKVEPVSGNTVSYKMYKSTLTYDAGDLTLVVSNS